MFLVQRQPTEKHHVVIKDAHFAFVYPYLWNNMHSWTLEIRRLCMYYDSGTDNYIRK